MKRKTNTGAIGFIMLLLFIAAVVLIGSGIAEVSLPAAKIFLGMVLLYVGYCLSGVINHARKDDAK